MKRYLALLGAALVLGLVLMFAARSLRAPRPVEVRAPEIPSVELAFTHTKDGISPATSFTKSHSPFSITLFTIWRASCFMRGLRSIVVGTVNSSRISRR